MFLLDVLSTSNIKHKIITIHAYTHTYKQKYFVPKITYTFFEKVVRRLARCNARFCPSSSTTEEEKSMNPTPKSMLMDPSDAQFPLEPFIILTTNATTLHPFSAKACLPAKLRNEGFTKVASRRRRKTSLRRLPLRMLAKPTK